MSDTKKPQGSVSRLSPAHIFVHSRSRVGGCIHCGAVPANDPVCLP